MEREAHDQQGPAVACAERINVNDKDKVRKESRLYT